MRAYRAGDTVEDVCRACKLDRLHTVIAADAGVPVRVQCDYCGSQHQFRGGPADRVREEISRRPRAGDSPRAAPAGAERAPFPIVADRERSHEAVMVDSPQADLEVLLRRIVREEAGVTPVVPADKWRGGTLVLKPGNPALQDKTWPIETLFHKIVMIRNRLRTLEQQVNASELGEDAKIRLQAYITACYGSLTSFNVLFADEEDQFKGSGE